MTKEFANSPVLQSSDQANAKQAATNGGLALFGKAKLYNGKYDTGYYSHYKMPVGLIPIFAIVR